MSGGCSSDKVDGLRAAAAFAYDLHGRIIFEQGFDRAPGQRLVVDNQSFELLRLCRHRPVVESAPVRKGMTSEAVTPPVSLLLSSKRCSVP